MKKWEGIVDRLVTDVIGDGDVSHLPGAGKKLALSDDSNTPTDLRAAFKIMADHDVLPEWIADGERLEKMEAALRQQIERRARQHLKDKRAATSTGSSASLPRLESNWSRYKERYLERVERYNREALVYNLKLPRSLPHRQTLRGEALIEGALAKAKARQ